MKNAILGCEVRINAAGTVRCEPSWSWSPRAAHLPDFDLWFVWAGRGELTDKGTTHAVGPGSAFLLRRGQAYDARHDPAHPLGVCYVHFDFLDARGRVWHPREEDLPPLHCVLPDVPFYEQVLRRVTELAGSADEPAGQEARSLLRAVLAAVVRQGGEGKVVGAGQLHARRLAPVLRGIRENPAEATSIARLAGEAGYSVDHFTRVFRQVTGVNPKEFCLRVRIERARQLLRETDMPVEAVARALSYPDVFFFSRQFKARTGYSPTQWRKREG